MPAFIVHVFKNHFWDDAMKIVTKMLRASQISFLYDENSDYNYVALNEHDGFIGIHGIRYIATKCGKNSL